MAFSDAFDVLFTQSGSVAAGTYAQAYKVYQRQDRTVTMEGSWDFGTTYKDVHGTSSSTLTQATACNFTQWYVTGSAATGTYRGMYMRLYLTGGAGGEAGRFYTTVSANAPTDTVNGVHCSLSFGASAGNVTGLGTAGRFTLHVPNRSLGGTTAATQAELYADGASSAVGGICSLQRFVIGGNATGIATLQASNAVVAWHFDAGCVNATNGVVDSNLTASTQGGAIRIYIDGVGVRYIPYITGS